eukprot:Gb_06480 [translate_table: standard]
MKEDSRSEENARNHGGPAYYGTFHGTGNYPQPAIGFPQPMPPPGAGANESYYQPGYQAVPGYPSHQQYPPVAEGRPLREERLPCCGLGIGWALFICGFIFASIPWYVGAFLLFCVRQDYREKPGLVACTIAAILAALAVILGATKGADVW